jgi:hypothetical protein
MRIKIKIPPRPMYMARSPVLVLLMKRGGGVRRSSRYGDGSNAAGYYFTRCETAGFA